MKLYLAGTRHDPNLHAVRDALLAAGHSLTSRWHDQPSGDQDGSAASRSVVARTNFADLAAADAVVVSSYDGHHLRGAHTEVGWCIAKGKPVVVVGPPLNTMTEVTGVMTVGSVALAVRLLADIATASGLPPAVWPADPKRIVEARRVPDISAPGLAPGAVEVRELDGKVWGYALSCPGCARQSYLALTEDQPHPRWAVTTGIPAIPDTVTLSPSIHHTVERGGCGWHGYLSSGVFRPC